MPLYHSKYVHTERSSISKLAVLLRPSPKLSMRSRPSIASRYASRTNTTTTACARKTRIASAHRPEFYTYRLKVSKMRLRKTMQRVEQIKLSVTDL
jgi:hypothetical protein